MGTSGNKGPSDCSSGKLLPQRTAGVVQRGWPIATLGDGQKSGVKAPEQAGFAVRRAGERAVRDEQVEPETSRGLPSSRNLSLMM